MAGATLRELLDSADAARASGRGQDAARLYDDAATRARGEDDLVALVDAVLGAASVYVFGAEPGKLPAELYDVLARTTDTATRARLCAALARCWAYAGHPDRSRRFAAQATDLADEVGDPVLVADSLDAALAAHWGPDDLEARRALTARLSDVAAHELDPNARLRAHLWGLQVACEMLEVPTIHREMRALEALGEESARARFFAATRRAMLDLLRGRTDTTERLAGIAEAAADESGLADAWMVVKALRFYSAALAGDVAACARGAAEAEEFGRAEGATAVLAEAAFLWTCAGDDARVRELVDTFAGDVLDVLPRDVNWLLTLQCVLEAALAVDDRDVATTAARLLAPYEGRAVVNAGAVMFHGMTDDTLARAAALADDAATATRLRARALATYERLGAQWWRTRLESWQAPVAPTEHRVHLHPAPGGLWLVGTEPDAVSMSPLRGFAYLRELLRRPGQPIAALELVRAVEGVVVVESGLGEVLDQEALRAYRSRLRDLDEELAEAQEWADAGRSDALRLERDAIVDELARATGLGGRARTPGSSQERARVAVRKAVSAALARIALVDQPVARHLEATVRTGLTCRYEAETPAAITWVLQ